MRNANYQILYGNNITAFPTRFVISNAAIESQILVAAFTGDINFHQSDQSLKGSYSNTLFCNNVILVESSLPIILECATSKFISKPVTFKEACYVICKQNPIQIQTSIKDIFYQTVLKKLLFHLFLGMNPYEVWDGTYKTDGLSIVIERNKQPSYINIYHREFFEEFLFQNATIKGSNTGVEICHC